MRILASLSIALLFPFAGVTIAQAATSVPTTQAVASVRTADSGNTVDIDEGDIKVYCHHIGYSDAIWVHEEGEDAAYGYRCVSPGWVTRFSMTELCQYNFGSDWTDRTRDANNRYSWQCIHLA